jgi:16S rRNA (uracil1498-N3)-methyltransferase
MHRFYLPPAESGGDVLTLSGREAHHALHVLRIQDGEHVMVLDGAGHEVRCEVRGHKRDSVSLRVLERTAIAPLPFSITLLQAIPKGKIIESIIQKATELGAARIVPILSERVVTHLDRENARDKAGKWQVVAIEATKQCGNAWLPKVEAPQTVETFLARREKFELPLIGCLEPDSRHPREWFQEFIASRKRLPQSVCAWVGPEGDFSPAEYRAIKQSGALPITLGRLVLRTETAATYCLSVLNYELQAPQVNGTTRPKPEVQNPQSE